MANELGLKITGMNTSGFDKKAQEYLERVKTELQTALPVIAEEMAADVRARTPSKETEYEYLMTGASRAAKLVPLDGDHSADNDADTKTGQVRDRIRFMRHPGFWLEDLVVTPGIGFTVDSSNLRIDLGIISQLEAFSHFSWQNHSHRLGTFQHETEYGVWSFFEYGYSFHVWPKNKTALKYKLTPDEDTRVWEMYKDYPAFRMFSGFNKSTFVEAVSARIRDVK